MYNNIPYIIATFVCLIVLIKYLKKEVYDNYKHKLNINLDLFELIITTFMSFVFSAIVSFVFIMLIDMIDFHKNAEYQLVYKNELLAINDYSGLKGNRYAISTTTDIKILVEDNGACRINTLKADMCNIYEDNERYVEYYVKKSTKSFVRKIIGINTLFEGESDAYYNLHIPKGTLVTDFNINLE